MSFVPINRLKYGVEEWSANCLETIVNRMFIFYRI